METELTQSAEQTQQEDNSFDGLMDSAAERASGVQRQDFDDQGPEPTDEETVETAPEPEPQATQSFDAPQHWAEVDRQKFKRLPPDQQEWLLNRHSAMEADYTKKAQQVAEYRQQIANFLQQQAQQKQQAEQPKAEKPKFDDPVEELKWEATQAAKAELQKELQQRDQRLNVVQHQMYVEGVKQHFKSDPMYSQVQTLIHEHVRNLPPSVGQDLYRRLDADPRAYAEMYQTVRGRLSELAQTQRPQAQAQPQGPQAQKRETRAPILESGGSDPGSHVGKAQAKQNDIIKRVRAGKASSGDLGSYLDAIGAVDRLVG